MPVPAAQPAAWPSTSRTLFTQEPPHHSSCAWPGCFHPSHVLGQVPCPCGDTTCGAGTFSTPNPGCQALGTLLFCPSHWTSFKLISPNRWQQGGNSKQGHRSLSYEE